MNWADCFDRASEYDVRLPAVRETLAERRSDD